MKDISFKQLLVLMVITFVVGLLVLDFFGGGDLFWDRCARSCNTTTTSHDASKTYTISRKPKTNKYGYPITTTRSSTTRSKTWTTTRRRKSTTKVNDPYNARDYANEEDFYDDNADFFYDYYDAENYYKEHAD